MSQVRLTEFFGGVSEVELAGQSEARVTEEGIDGTSKGKLQASARVPDIRRRKGETTNKASRSGATGHKPAPILQPEMLAQLGVWLQGAGVLAAGHAFFVMLANLYKQ